MSASSDQKFSLRFVIAFLFGAFLAVLPNSSPAAEMPELEEGVVYEFNFSDENGNGAYFDVLIPRDVEDAAAFEKLQEEKIAREQRGEGYTNEVFLFADREQDLGPGRSLNSFSPLPWISSVGKKFKQKVTQIVFGKKAIEFMSSRQKPPVPGEKLGRNAIVGFRVFGNFFLYASGIGLSVLPTEVFLGVVGIYGLSCLITAKNNLMLSNLTFRGIPYDGILPEPGSADDIALRQILATPEDPNNPFHRVRTQVGNWVRLGVGGNAISKPLGFLARFALIELAFMVGALAGDQIFDVASIAPQIAVTLPRFATGLGIAIATQLTFMATSNRLSSYLPTRKVSQSLSKSIMDSMDMAASILTNFVVGLVVRDATFEVGLYLAGALFGVGAASAITLNHVCKLQLKSKAQRADEVRQMIEMRNRDHNHGSEFIESHPNLKGNGHGRIWIGIKQFEPSFA